MGVKSLIRHALVSDAVRPFVAGRSATAHATVLMYHELGPDDQDVEAWTVVRRRDFLEQVKHLRRSYEIVSLEEALAKRGESAANGRPMAVLTFDDGDVNNHDILLPIVEREDIPVLVYIATGHVQEGRCYWFDRVINAVQGHAPIHVDLGRAGLGNFHINRVAGAANWAEIHRMLEALKIVDPTRREALADEIAEQTKASATPPAVRPLSIEQVRALGRSPRVTIGAHSHCHNLLTQISLEEARASILKSASLLREWSGQPVRHFAYPNGTHDSSVVAMVEGLGFASATSTRAGLWQRGEHPLRIPRLGVGRYDSLDTFKFNLLGLRNQKDRDPTSRSDAVEPAGSA